MLSPRIGIQRIWNSSLMRAEGGKFYRRSERTATRGKRRDPSRTFAYSALQWRFFVAFVAFFVFFGATAFAGVTTA